MTILLGNSDITQIVQTGLLSRSIGQRLFPALLWRAAAYREPWEAAAGQSMTFTNPGLMDPDTDPRTPGVAPAFQDIEYEKYTATMKTYGWPTSVHMPSSAVAITSDFYQKLQAMGLAAGQTMGRLARNELFRSYLAGNGLVDLVSGGGLEIRVNSLNGFAESIDPSSGFPVVTSSAAPRQFLKNGVLIPAATSVIIGAVPDDAAKPFGSGTLTITADVSFVAGDRITALDASTVIRPKNVTSVDGITAAHRLSMQLIGRAVIKLRRNDVGPCEDGKYHIHLDPLGTGDLFDGDNSFQRQIEQRGLDDDPYKYFAVGQTRSSNFFDNNESPALGTVRDETSSRPNDATSAIGSNDIGGDIVNKTGIPIMRTIVIGESALNEKFFPESAYMSEAGVSGKVGGYRVAQGGVELNLDGIRCIIKAPQDWANETVTQGWSWTGAFKCATNRLTGRNTTTSKPAFKRAVVIETAMIDD